MRLAAGTMESKAQGQDWQQFSWALMQPQVAVPWVAERSPCPVPRTRPPHAPLRDPGARLQRDLHLLPRVLARPEEVLGERALVAARVHLVHADGDVLLGPQEVELVLGQRDVVRLLVAEPLDRGVVPVLRGGAGAGSAAVSGNDDDDDVKLLVTMMMLAGTADL